MPAPWKYEHVALDEDLAQGDVLIPSPELQNLSTEVHPHFSDPKYVAFLVTTQTCDLVRRGGECSTHYINVAVVRPLRDILGMLLDAVCERVREGCYIDKHKSRAQQMLGRMFNQNEQAMGLFYLYPDARLELSHDAVALLRVSVSFRVQNYSVLCEARRVRVPSEFANKLGWIAGNLYSRIGTPDWQEAELKDIVNDYLSSDSGAGTVWIKEAIVKQLRKDGVDVDQLTLEELRAKARTNLLAPKQVGISRIIEAVKEVFPEINDKPLGRLQTRLKNDPVLTKSFRQQ